MANHSPKGVNHLCAGSRSPESCCVMSANPSAPACSPNTIFAINGFLAVPAFLQTNITAPVGPPIVDANFTGAAALPQAAPVNATANATATPSPDALAPSAMVADVPTAAEAPIDAATDARVFDPPAQTASNFSVAPSSSDAGRGDGRQSSAMLLGAAGALVAACCALCA